MLRRPLILAIFAATAAASVALAAQAPVCDVPPDWYRGEPPNEAKAEGVTLLYTHDRYPAMIGLGLYPADRTPAARADHISAKLERLGVRVTSKRGNAKYAAYEWEGPTGSQIVGRTVVRVLSKTDHVMIVGFWPIGHSKLSVDFDRIAVSARKP